MPVAQQEYVFRFFTVRSGNLEAKSERAPQRLLVYTRPTPFGQRLQQLTEARASAAEIQRAVVGYQSSAEHVKKLRGLPFDVTKGLDWIAANGSKPLADLDFAAAFHELYGTTAKKIVASADYLTTLDRKMLRRLRAYARGGRSSMAR
ncbi:MAG: hypothetical protein HC868_14765 [Sphingomonadales bacterium]|nr:hypothetical protein [Sphingomonadales bacterium]